MLCLSTSLPPKTILPLKFPTSNSNTTLLSTHSQPVARSCASWAKHSKSSQTFQLAEPSPLSCLPLRNISHVWSGLQPNSLLDGRVSSSSVPFPTRRKFDSGTFLQGLQLSPGRLWSRAPKSVRRWTIRLPTQPSSVLPSAWKSVPTSSS